MIWFSLEVKYQSDQESSKGREKLFDSAAGFHSGRLAARGNATSFMLPWQGILQELRQLEKEGRQGSDSALPVAGDRLGSVVQILLKINDATSKDNLPRFIHQANVRRESVKRHIKMMKKRGHRASVNVDVEAMERKAEQLPKNGVPPEIVRILPHDTTLDKLMVQKNATP